MIAYRARWGHMRCRVPQGWLVSTIFGLAGRRADQSSCGEGMVCGCMTKGACLPERVLVLLEEG